MNSKLNWNDSTNLQAQSPSIVFAAIVFDTICLGMPRFSVFILI